MLNIKSLIAATLLSGVAAMSFAATPEAPKAVAAPAVAAAPAAAPAADAMAKPAMKKHAKKHVKKVKAAEAVAK
jgi:hypothetical protein